MEKGLQGFASDRYDKKAAYLARSKGGSKLGVKKGFAAMPKEKLKKIAQKGGQK